MAFMFSGLPRAWMVSKRGSVSSSGCCISATRRRQVGWLLAAISTQPPSRVG